MNLQENETAKSVRQQLIDEMRSGIYVGQERLPRENVLCEKMGISRTQLRDVLAALEREGYITRRHGIGTLINHHVLQVPNRVDIAVEFLDIIRQNGYEPGTAYVQAQEGIADDEIAAKLKLSPGTPILQIVRLCTADGQPAIYCEDFLPKRLVRKEYTEEDLAWPIYTFLPKICGVSAYMDLTEIHAVAADQTVADALGLAVGTPVFNLEEVDYDIDGIRFSAPANFLWMRCLPKSPCARSCRG